MKLDSIKEQYERGLITKPEFIRDMHGVHSMLFDYARTLPKTGITRIEITDERVIMTTRSEGIKILVDPLDRRTPPIESLNFGDFEALDSAWLFSLVRDGDVVFDIGANVGWYSCNIARRFPLSPVHAFEPIPRTFATLEANIQLNGLADRVTLHPLALSNKCGELTFQTDPNDAGASTCAAGPASATTQTVTCRVTTLDEHFSQLNLPSLDVIKCDVEGAELMVFQGGLRTLEKYKPVVFCEMLRKWAARLGYHPNDIIALFAGLGYRCYFATARDLVEIKAMDENTTETNFFFLHQSREDRFEHLIQETSVPNAPHFNLSK